MKAHQTAKNNSTKKIDKYEPYSSLDGLNLEIPNQEKIFSALLKNSFIKEKNLMINESTQGIINKAAETDKEIAELKNKKKGKKADDLAKNSLYTKKKLEEYAAHAAIFNSISNFYKEGFLNYPGSLKKKDLFPGVSILERKIKQGFENYVPLTEHKEFREEVGSYKITDEEKFIDAIKNTYQKNNLQLHPVVEKRIRDHLKSNNFILPQKAGIPGLHAEVQALNSMLNSIEPDNVNKEIHLEAPYFKNLIHTHLFTKRLVGKKGEDFPACHNCSGILKSPLSVVTGVVDSAGKDHSSPQRRMSIPFGMKF
ncbi:YwqJ-related putative deaminase [Mycetohabitans sp. B46]|uniref:YwqJ-related putative deaminase n=1 Tax=Mycetohabitans sp. B46 TaxID=2772536 RepID=UPI00307F5AE6